MNKVLVPVALVAGLVGGFFIPHSHSHNAMPSGTPIGYTVVCQGGNQVMVKLQGVANDVALVPEYKGTYVYMTKNTQIANGLPTYETFSETTPHSCSDLTSDKTGAVAGTNLVAVTWVPPAFVYWGK